MEEIGYKFASKEVASMDSSPMEVDLEGTVGDSPQTYLGSKKTSSSPEVELFFDAGTYF
jgi:hypothetical protein